MLLSDYLKMLLEGIIAGNPSSDVQLSERNLVGFSQVIEHTV